MEGRIELSALERTRLLSSMSSGSLGPIGTPSTYSASESLAQLRSGQDRARAGSPTNLHDYQNRYLPTSGLHPASSSYAMMAGYLASGHVPESLKHMLPDMQQYWAAAAHSEGYARYVLSNMYYPYLPYLPATESLAMFAQTSAGAAAHLEALQAQAAVQHRIYDLQKEAMLNSGGFSPGMYPHPHQFSPHTGQAEATNLSLPGSKSKCEMKKDDEQGMRETNIKCESYVKQKTQSEDVRKDTPDVFMEYSYSVEGSERTRGKASKTDDREKIKSSSKALKSPSLASTNCWSENNSIKFTHCDTRPSSVVDKTRIRTISPEVSRERHISAGSIAGDTSRKRQASSSSKASLHSPSYRQTALASPDHRSTPITTARKEYVISPFEASCEKITIIEQEMPENLCIKDKKPEIKTDSDNKADNKDEKDRGVVTLNVTSPISVTITTTVNTITSDSLSADNVSKHSKASSLSPSSHGSPPLSHTSTTTTYSLPYYHNLFSRVQSGDGKKVHATTYVPAIGTISSPVAGAPSIIQVKDPKAIGLSDTEKDIPMKYSETVKNNKTSAEKLFSDVNQKYVATVFDKDSVCIEQEDTSVKFDKESKLIEKNETVSETLDLRIKSKTVQDSKTKKESEIRSKKTKSEKRQIAHSSVTPIKQETKGSLKRKEYLHSKINGHSSDDKTDTHTRNTSKTFEERQDVQKKSSIIADKLPKEETLLICKPKKCDTVSKNDLQVPLTILDISDVVSMSATELNGKERIKENDKNKQHSQKQEQHDKPAPLAPLKQTKIVKPMSSARRDGSGQDCVDGLLLPPVSDRPPATQQVKPADTHTQHSGIPIGIAVARQRNIAPKLTGDSRKANDEAKGKHQVADVKPIRPLKVIRPSTKPTGSAGTKVEKINELPANLIVTGGTAPQGMLWPDDASRQLAAQFLQGGAPLTPTATSWYSQGAYPFPQPATTAAATNTAGQLPLTVPAGYKLAQDSITGQIWLVPSGTDVFDNSRLFGGSLHLGGQIGSTSTFATAPLVGGGQQGVTSGIPSQGGSLFPGQTMLTDRQANVDIGLQPFLPIFGQNILPTAELGSGAEDKDPVEHGKLPPTMVVPPVTDTANPLNVSIHNNEERHELSSIPHTSAAAGLTERSPFNFAQPPVPIMFNSTFLSAPPQPEVNPPGDPGQLELASVQSRGTSPMLPACDSCNEEVKSDDNADDIIDICDHEDDDMDEHEKDLQSETICDEVPNSKDTIEVKRESDTLTCKTEISVNKIDTNKSNFKTVDNYTFPRETNQCKIEDSACDKNTNGIPKNEVSSEDTPDANKRHVDPNRNIFKDITEKYDPFLDPQVLQAADGLELLSALAEKSALVVKPKTEEDEKKDKGNLLHKQVVQIDPSIGSSEKDEKNVPKKKSRVKYGYASKITSGEKDKPAVATTAEKKMTTFCGIIIPEDEEVMDSIELEMKLRLSELQRRYREKQRQLARLTPRKPRDQEAEVATKNKQPPSDSPRGPGRPKKRPSETSTSSEKSLTPKSSKVKGSDGTSRKSPPSSGSSSTSGHHGPPQKKKKLAEMLVDRVFRKTGSSFKIPLSKKINLIAPARIEFPGRHSRHQDRPHGKHKKSMDFGRLIKRSRLSQINGKDAGFVGGFWSKRSHEKKHHFHSDAKLKKKKKRDEGAPRERPAEGGLGLLAEYAARSRDDNADRKRKQEDSSGSLSPDSPNKKRKPGRPKKCDSVRPGVTETLVAKQSKHMEFFRLHAEEPQKERKITLEGKTPLKPLYLDEWNVRRSERIFLNDPSPQTSPNAAPQGPPGAKPKPQTPDPKQRQLGSPGAKLRHDSPRSDWDAKHRADKQKKSQTLNMSLKVKKKYSTGLLQQNKAREKTTELLQASRERLFQHRQERKEQEKPTSPRVASPEIGSDQDDVPLSMFRDKPCKVEDQPPCTLSPDGLEDGLRILVFMDGLFHEGELKAIRPPDIYGAVLDNERKTRPHYYSQEEILKEAIKDTRAAGPEQLQEGTRICAYWSQQFSCLYPGTISKGSPNPSTADRDLYTVEFDDGDTGRIPLDHIRIIPQDFPLVEYDPNPLLLLTKRRRTTSVSEGSEHRKSVSDPLRRPQSEAGRESKGKRGPGRPPKTDRMLSNESIGDEDVFTSDARDGRGDAQSGQGVVFAPPRGLWAWSGCSTKRPGMKGKARKEYYKTVVRNKESISVGECAVFISTGRPNLPYVGRIESFWEARSGQMVVKVKWFYHPEETKGGKRLHNLKGALFRSDHEDENDVQTISHKCDVIPYSEYRRRVDVISHDDHKDVYYLAGYYEPTVGHIKFEPGVL
ncbi:uncharacterized protein LOC128244317 isoform X2 [Mya arenaria]|uniref:uncharacterized protein LOC128244317 isoform X2 n=1 Tax=Mya arenaria TaxID=6604 RepID=UPI0022E48C8F|nr:uncharacterized protein LOC128244317 isoform X2 [Mya arenaria]